MEVRNYSASGKALFTGTVQQGQHLGPLVARRLWINFGNPGNVKAAVNGRPVTIPGAGRSVMVLVSSRGISVSPATA
jgi:hypothetical protein